MIISGFLVIGAGILGLSIARELKKDILNLALLSWRKKANGSGTKAFNVFKKGRVWNSG